MADVFSFETSHPQDPPEGIGDRALGDLCASGLPRNFLELHVSLKSGHYFQKKKCPPMRTTSFSAAHNN